MSTQNVYLVEEKHIILARQLTLSVLVGDSTQCAIKFAKKFKFKFLQRHVLHSELAKNFSW